MGHQTQFVDSEFGIFGVQFYFDTESLLGSYALELSQNYIYASGNRPFEKQAMSRQSFFRGRMAHICMYVLCYRVSNKKSA